MAHKAEVHDAEYHKILKDLAKKEICLNQLLLTEKVNCPYFLKKEISYLVHLEKFCLNFSSFFFLNLH